jgi:hypothetical protein
MAKNEKKNGDGGADDVMTALVVIVVVLGAGASTLAAKFKAKTEAATEAAQDAVPLLAVVGLVVGVVGLVLLTAWAVKGWAWWSGWSPTRARRLMVGAWVPAGLLLALTWPGQMSLGQAVGQVRAGQWAGAAALVVWLVLPLGVSLGAYGWFRTWRQAVTGQIHDPRRAGQWAHRQFQHAMRRARREARRPGMVPVLNRAGQPVLGRAAAVTEGAAVASLVPQDPRHLVVPLEAIAKHLLIVGEPGVGKTVLLLRLMRIWLEGTWLRYLARSGDRPLVIFLDCKGGHDGRDTAEKFRQMGKAMGLVGGRIGLWPSDIRLDLWSLPPERLAEVLVEMAASTHEFFGPVQDELVWLAVGAPSGPPTSSVDFVGRLHSEWLLKAWAGHPGEMESIKENKAHFAGIAAKYRSLFRRLGRAFDAGRHLDDFDAVCLTIEGTQNEKTASAQAQAIVELVTDLATRRGPSGKKRQILFPIDEFSAVSSKVVIARLMERVRSLGVAVIPIGQSWVSLGEREDDRKRIREAAAGGLLVMSTSDPEALAAAAGTGTVVEAGTKRLESGGWGDEGTGRSQRAYVMDPDWVRSLGRYPGQVAYVDHGVVTWGVVAPADLDDRALGLPSPMRTAIRANWRPVLGARVPIAELEAGLTRLDVLAGQDEQSELPDPEPVRKQGELG